MIRQSCLINSVQLMSSCVTSICRPHKAASEADTLAVVAPSPPYYFIPVRTENSREHRML